MPPPDGGLITFGVFGLNLSATHASIRRGGHTFLFTASILLVAQGCGHGVGVSPSPAQPWTPPPKLEQHELPAPSKSSIPPELLSSEHGWTLGDLVDIGLRNSTQTREAWENARAAAAAHKSDRGAWFPRIDASANYTRQKSGGFNGRPSFEQGTYGGELSLDYLIFNFGGRRATIEESRQALLVSDWTHNAVIQGTILDVIETYFQYVTARALAASADTTQKEAQTNLDAAQARYDAGVATIADVLQARTALAQAQLALDGYQGQIETTRGALATAMGLPASTAFDVAVEEEPPPVREVGEAVEAYLARAEASRPDLAAARAEAEKADAHTRVVKSEGYPSITANGSLGRTYLESTDTQANTYFGVIQAQVPLFTGLSHHYDVKEAEAQARAAEARLASVHQQIVLDVWTTYFNLRTARQRLATSEELLKSATENHDVATGRYSSGVGTFLDLLAAQSALANARAVGAQARADWYVALAELAHATGTLTPDLRSVADSTLGTPNK
jgi:outer membrane protein TolC